MHKYLLSVLFGFTMLMSGSAMAKADKVGVVDYQQLMQAIPFSVIMQNKLKSSMEQTRSHFQEMNTVIKAKQEALSKNEESWTDAQKKTAKTEIAELKKDLSKKQMEVRAQAMERQKGMQKEIQTEIQNIAEKVAKQKGLSRVYRSDSLIYDANRTDITAEVTEHLIKVYNVTPEMKATQMSRQMPMGGMQGRRMNR